MADLMAESLRCQKLGAECHYQQKSETYGAACVAEFTRQFVYQQQLIGSDK